MKEKRVIKGTFHIVNKDIVFVPAGGIRFFGWIQRNIFKDIEGKEMYVTLEDGEK